eukprot:CAMPEP_0204604076 /NCGR_PEP_ID=MMETSP0661-20131031/57639_1 /ASSEMBLY_ACC=CAM_ASM_000606 /TAXON_ID=109239 /ORGANISM="Alexandrium margalefi, Strain AMGDE01CS-322" /LENGTH=131 /DNA_ID=CAMNT_0051615201 /DNA_START=90 /DNA_END=485 /DNA_ORIENTATION=-
MARIVSPLRPLQRQCVQSREDRSNSADHHRLRPIELGRGLAHRQGPPEVPRRVDGAQASGGEPHGGDGEGGDDLRVQGRCREEEDVRHHAERNDLVLIRVVGGVIVDKEYRLLDAEPMSEAHATKVGHVDP